MHVLVVTEEPIDFSGPMVRGGQIHVRNVVRGLRDRGHDVHLVDWNDAPTEPFQRSVSPRTRFVDGPLRTYRRLLDVADSLDPDVIVSKTRKVYLPGWLAARRLGIPHVVHVGSSLDPAETGLLSRIDAASGAARIRFPHDGYFVVCDALGAELADRGIPEEAIYNVRNAVDTDRFRPEGPIVSGVPEEAVSGNDPVLGFVGSVSRKKGVFDLADAVEEAAADPIVLVAGDGPDRNTFESELGDLGHFLGSVPYDDMPAVYRSVDALVLPSYGEGLPRVVLEAQSSATLVIASRVGGIPEVVTDDETGVLFDVGDVGSLATAIDDVGADPKTMNAIARRGRSNVREQWSWDHLYERYERFLERIVGSR